MSLVEKLFGSFSDRELKKINPIAKQVLALEEKYAAMPDADLQAQTAVFKQQLADGKTTDDILPDAFAVCREAAWRVLGMKHFPVQVIGGIALHRGDISEMQTGEGKTLVATLPAYLNALTGEGVHVVTVNDYLAKRDSEWMGKLYRWLGLSVGLIAQGMDGDARRAAYAADITYGTNNEFGFDYLRDNMVTYKANMVQRGHAYAIVDEVDSILIDEARTPLIISGRGEDSSSLYTQVDRFVRTLRKSVVVELEDKVSTDEQTDGDYVVDEKHKTCTLTASGIKKAEAYFKVENLAAAENMTLAHHIDQAIKAYGVMQRDIDYVVKDGQVIIVDEFTGRLMIGRRYNEGLHQAIEAKEGVKIAAESKTLATITFQNYFRMYKKLSGMTGTAKTEATEFTEIYGLNIVSVPTNRPVQRKDYPDAIYKTINGKYNAVIQQVMECHKNGQPVLVGTVSVEKSETLAKMLQKYTRDFNVLNAKNHEREAEIVAQAGKKGAITIATNMAGRGTDIMLGGNAEYMAKAQMRKEHFCEKLLNVLKRVGPFFIYQVDEGAVFGATAADGRDIAFRGLPQAVSVSLLRVPAVVPDSPPAAGHAHPGVPGAELPRLRAAGGAGAAGACDRRQLRERPRAAGGDRAGHQHAQRDVPARAAAVPAGGVGAADPRAGGLPHQSRQGRHGGCAQLPERVCWTTLSS